MKTLRSFSAAIAAYVGIVSLGSCSHDEVMASQGEQEMSMLRVSTRTDGDDTPVKEGIIYIFNQKGSCTGIINPEEVKNQTPIPAQPGTIDIISVGSNNLNAYKLPDKDKVNDTTIIKLNSGQTMSDLILGTATITLGEGESTQLIMTSTREVICINSITAEKVPSDVIRAEVLIGPVYKNIRLNGKYTNDTDSIRIMLAKDADKGKWTLQGDSIFSLPTKGNPSFVFRLKMANSTEEYTYQRNSPLVKNRFVHLNIVYQEGLKTYITGPNFTAPEWEGTDTIACQFTMNDKTRSDTLIHLKPGSTYDRYFVVSVNKADRTAVLLRRTKDTGILSDSMMITKASSINKPNWATSGWRLPTQEECQYILEKGNMEYKDGKFSELSDLIIPGTYYCTSNNKLATMTLEIPDTKKLSNRRITLNTDADYSKDYIFRPVIEISY